MEKELIAQILKKEKTESPKEEKLSLISILWQKFCLWIELNDLSDTFLIFGKIFLIAIFGVILYFPEQSIQKLQTIIEFKDFYLPKFFVGGFFIFFSDKIFRVIFTSMSKINIKNPIKKSELGCIFGIPNEEIIDHLITEKTFKQIDCKNKFALNQQQFDAIAKRLEKIGVLIRGGNNSRIFDEKFSRQDLSEIFGGKTSPDELETLWKKTDQGLSSLPESFNSNKIKITA